MNGASTGTHCLAFCARIAIRASADLKSASPRGANPAVKARVRIAGSDTLPRATLRARPCACAAPATYQIDAGIRSTPSQAVRNVPQQEDFS